MPNDFRKLQSALPALIGRTIERITVRQHDRDHTQLFLFFADGTYYEFYMWSTVSGIRHLDVGGIEAMGPLDYIPTGGMLDVLSGKTAIIVERPVPQRAGAAS
jgi:hypothetical protein